MPNLNKEKAPRRAYPGYMGRPRLVRDVTERGPF